MKIIIANKLIVQDIPAEFESDLQQKLKFINPKWEENNRLGRWNGETPKHLIFYQQSPLGGLVIPRGYIRRLLLDCRNRNVTYTLIDRRRTLPPTSFTFTGQLESFQQEATTKMLSKEFGVLCAPTGSGKTVMALYMIAMRRQPALIVVHNKDLALQWMERIKTFLGIPEDEIGFIGSGRRQVGEKITLCMVQTLYKCADEIAPEIGYLVTDECHRTPSRTFTEAIASFDSRYMLGLSATPWRRDKLSQLIYWHLGDLHFNISSAELVETGHILEAEVIFRHTSFKPYHDPVNEYSKMLSELTADDERNHLIAADVAEEAARNNGAILVLSDRKKHCLTLQSLLRYKHKVQADVVTGDVSLAQRKELFAQLNQGQINVIIATGQLVGEGFDCKTLTTLFIATPIKFSGRVIQYIGRILRPAPDKAKPRVFDYVDAEVGPLKVSADARLAAYRKVFPELRTPAEYHP